MIAQFIDDDEAVARKLRETITFADDASVLATVDLLTQRLRSHEKTIWMLRSIVG